MAGAGPPLVSKGEPPSDGRLNVDERELLRSKNPAVPSWRASRSAFLILLFLISL
ncbi:MAG: hypothetical protein ACTSXC_06200 [Candidatus Freyarchaeota archaeon]